MFARLLLLFTVVPLVELYILVRMGRLVGVWPTVAFVVLTGAAGAALARAQGLGVVRRIQGELQRGSLPTEALVDGLLILIAGAVLLTPGLLTDLLGFLLLVPQGRTAVRRVVSRELDRRIRRREPDVIDAEWRPGD